MAPFNRKPLLYVCTCFLVLPAYLILIRCSEERTVGNAKDIFQWTFTGYVVDGYSGKNLKNVSITYVNEDGQTVTVRTNGATGGFTIQNLPAGQRNFFFVKDSSDAAEPQYTQKILTLVSGGQNPDSLTIPVDISAVVKLFPLTGALTGTVKSRLYSNGLALPAKHVVVKVRYTAPAMQNAFPSTFETTTDSAGMFLFTRLPVVDSGVAVDILNTSIQNIPYKAAAFQQPALVPGQAFSLGIIYMEPVDLNNSRLVFVYSNVYDPHSGIIKNGFPVNGTIVITANKKIDSVHCMLKKDSAIIPVKTIISKDTICIIPINRLESGKLYTLYLTASSESGETQTIHEKNGCIQFMTGQGLIRVLKSNVLSDDGLGLNNVPVTINPFFVLSAVPETGSVRLEFVGGGSPKALVRVSRDTIFAHPVVTFEYNAKIKTAILGKDTAGNALEILLDGPKEFTTEDMLFPVASNTWDANGKPVDKFPLYDTMWVRYSEVIDTDTKTIEWQDPASPKKIFGTGSYTNASVWIRRDTVFVLPDIRLHLNWGDTAGFKICVRSSTGKKSTAKEFPVIVENKGIFVVWTNTQDSLGRMREDFGLNEHVVIVSNIPVKQIDSIRAFPGAQLPPDMSPNNFTIKKDTLVYASGIAMLPNTNYGMEFSMTFVNGIKMSHVMGVAWKTSSGVRIMRVDNKTGGQYRMLRVFGDSVSATFSKPIDTSAGAPTKWKVHMVDRNDREYAARTCWNDSLTKATIYPLDTLRAADADADPAYTVNAPNTRAIRAITFDLTSRDQEQVKKLGMPQCTIELHTEPGLCVMQSNIVRDHDPSKPVAKEEPATDHFSADSAVSITFNRPLDTMAIKNAAFEQFFTIRDTFNNRYSYIASFMSDCRTVLLRPCVSLPADQCYFLCLTAVPGSGIGSAKAVNKHAGSVTGGADNNALLKEPFRVQQSIKILSVNNKSGVKYRTCRVIRDTLNITFSKKIDTSAGAATVFRVHMVDNTDREYNTATRWDPSLFMVTITILDTLKTADADADPAYLDNAPNTRAIKNVTFDLTTSDGERAKRLGPPYGAIELHTEPGLCVTNANIVANHITGIPVSSTEKAVDNFSVDSAITITFNRRVDTAAIKEKGPELFFTIADQNARRYFYDISFSPDGRTVVLDPKKTLIPEQNYFVRLNAVPGVGITYAQPVNKHGGTVTGAADSGSLLKNQFRVQSGVKILFVNNKTGAKFRPFKVIDDTFTVVFSKPVDTSAQAPTRFKVYMQDKTAKQYRTAAAWDQTGTRATVTILDTMRTADADVDPVIAYTVNSPNTCAITAVLFDLTTRDGEQIKKLNAPYGNIELHTEPGLCAMNSNIVYNHDPTLPVLRTEKPVLTFNPDSAVTITFNRPLDTADIKKTDPQDYFSLVNDQYVRIPFTVRFASGGQTILIIPDEKLRPKGSGYYVLFKEVPGMGIKNALAINKLSGRVKGEGFNCELLFTPFNIRCPDITALAAVLPRDSNTFPGVMDNRIGVSPGMVYDEVVGTDNTFNISGYGSAYIMRLRIMEAAWNPAHDDSVSGYEIQVRKTDRAGNASPWYTLNNKVPALQYSPSSNGINFVSIDVRYEDFYEALLTPDKDGTAYFYSNGRSFFNDSCRFSIRVRPYVGQGQPANNQTGQWSNVLTYADNVAPCDSDFVTAQHCGVGYRGGIDVYDYVEWNNTQTDMVRTGYITVNFPEDMDITGPVPKISVYYGTFGGNPPNDSIEIATAGTFWSSARSYKCYFGIPPGDYTHANDSAGVYYNVSVAGCRDASGIVIQSYGTDGAKSKKHPTDTGRVNWKEATDQVQGSRSVIKRFRLCFYDSTRRKN